VNRREAARRGEWAQHFSNASCFVKSTEYISASTGPIFTIFLPYENYLREFSRSGPLFPFRQGTLPWQPILGKIYEMTFIQHAGISKRIRLSQFRLNGNIFSTYSAHFVKIGPVTPDKLQIVPRFDDRRSLPPGVRKWIGKSQF